jgi:hypothetical protein
MKNNYLMRKAVMKQVGVLVMLLAPIQELLMLNHVQDARYDG